MPGCSARNAWNSWEGFPSSCRRTRRTCSPRDDSLPLLQVLATLPQWIVHKEVTLARAGGGRLPTPPCFGDLIRTIALACPVPADVPLLVEVSNTTYAKDSGPKLRCYASFRIPVYWIVDLSRRIVEVRTEPFGRGKQAGYALCHTYREGDAIPVELDGQELGRVAVSDLLP